MDARDERIGMLVSTVPVRLVDVSRGGCRIEVGRHLAVGSNGQLQLELDGVLHVDDVRVCRCQQREGASRGFLLGVELLRTRRLSRRSLRLAVRRMVAERREPFADAPEAGRDTSTVDGRNERPRRGERAPPVPALTAI
jgi:hypothetical protein